MRVDKPSLSLILFRWFWKELRPEYRPDLEAMKYLFGPCCLVLRFARHRESIYLLKFTVV
jgi:hypothetical protein